MIGFGIMFFNNFRFNIKTRKLLTGIIFENLRILHNITPRDTYIENYEWHRKRHGDKYFDLYHFAFWYGINFHPQNIIEIGTRTGLSLAQLLSGYLDYTNIEVVSFDRFDDGLSNPELVKKHLHALGIPDIKITFHIGDSNELFPKWKQNNSKQWDWILVDGSHQKPWAMNDLENVKDIIKPGGILIMDDINASKEDGIDVPEIWAEFKSKYKSYFKFGEDRHGKGIGWGVKNNRFFLKPRPSTIREKNFQPIVEHKISSYFRYY